MSLLDINSLAIFVIEIPNALFMQKHYDEENKKRHKCFVVQDMNSSRIKILVFIKYLASIKKYWWKITWLFYERNNIC